MMRFLEEFDLWCKRYERHLGGIFERESILTMRLMLHSCNNRDCEYEWGYGMRRLKKLPLPMQRAKVGEPNRQVTIGFGGAVKDQAMTRTIHRLEAKKSFFIDFIPLLTSMNHVHIVHVVLPMTTCLPKGLFVKQRGHDLLIAEFVIFRS